MFPIRDHNPTGGPVFVVWLLLAANVAVFFLALVPEGAEGVLEWAFRFGVVPAALLRDPLDEAPRLVTHLFIHGSVAHLFGNMIFLFVFGDNVEDAFGHVTFALFYVGGGLVAAVSQILLIGDSPIPMVGASGAISAVLGAYIVLYPRKPVQAVVVPLIVPWLIVNLLVRTPRFFLWWLPAWVYLGFWALLQLWEGVADFALAGGVAWWAHVAGFAFGVVVSRSLARSGRSRRRDGGR